VQEVEKKAEEERIRMENIIKGNPLMQSATDKPADFKVKRRFHNSPHFEAILCWLICGLCWLVVESALMSPLCGPQGVN